MNLLVISISFLVKFWASLMCNNYIKTSRDHLTSSLPICTPLIFLSYWIALASALTTIWKRSTGSGYPCLALVLKGLFLGFHLGLWWLRVYHIIILYIVLKYVLSSSTFSRTFILWACWIMSKTFCASIEMIVWFLSLRPLVLFLTFIDVRMLNYLCVFRIKPTWSWHMVFNIYYI